MASSRLNRSHSLLLLKFVSYVYKKIISANVSHSVCLYGIRNTPGRNAPVLQDRYTVISHTPHVQQRPHFCSSNTYVLQIHQLQEVFHDVPFLLIEFVRLTNPSHVLQIHQLREVFDGVFPRQNLPRLLRGPEHLCREDIFTSVGEGASGKCLQRSAKACVSYHFGKNRSF